jgi:hypothetical protein
MGNAQNFSSYTSIYIVTSHKTGKWTLRAVKELKTNELSCVLCCNRRNCDERAASILRQHYGQPYFLPPSSNDRQKLDWIYLGSSGYRETMHVSDITQLQFGAKTGGVLQ